MREHTFVPMPYKCHCDSIAQDTVTKDVGVKFIKNDKKSGRNCDDYKDFLSEQINDIDVVHGKITHSDTEKTLVLLRKQKRSKF